jgi:3-oxoadipate enol-lactonase
MPRSLIRNLSLHYLDEGQGDVVLLLHGLGNSGIDWEFQVPALLAAGYRVIRPDFFGFGHSARPRTGYGPEAMAKDVQALLDNLDIAQAHLVGYSMGGAVAYQLAVSEPARWRSLGIISSVPCFVPQRLYDHWQFWMRRVLSRIMGMPRLAESLTQRLFEDRPDLIEKMRPRYAANDVGVYGKVLAALSGWDVREHLHKIACPVLILAAEFDYFRLKDVQDSMSGLSDVEIQIVKGTRHGLPMENPVAVNQTLLALFSRSKTACKAKA